MDPDPDPRSDLLDAVVVCRAEGRGEERPEALHIAGERLPVTIEQDAVVGARDAGGRSRRRLDVRLEDGRRLRLTRVLPDGAWQVWDMGRRE